MLKKSFCQKPTKKPFKTEKIDGWVVCHGSISVAWEPEKTEINLYKNEIITTML